MTRLNRPRNAMPYLRPLIVASLAAVMACGCGAEPGPRQTAGFTAASQAGRATTTASAPAPASVGPPPAASAPASAGAPPTPNASVQVPGGRPAESPAESPAATVLAATSPPTGTPTASATAPSVPTPMVAGSPFPTSTPRSAVAMLTTGSSTKIFWEGIAFRVPSSWTFQPANIDEHYIFIVGFIGTVPWTAECVPTTGPGTATGSMCHTEPALGPHSVTIAMETHDGPGPLEPAGYLRYQTGQTSILNVDGIPALIDRSGAGGPGTVVQLTIQRPARQGVWLTLTASYEGPGEAELAQQVDEVFNSLRVNPALPPLPTDETARSLAVARAIDALAQDPAQACYPRRPDASRRATVTAATTPGASPSPRKVTCRTELATVPGGFWKLTLTVEWGAPGDPATTGTTWMYLDPGGGPGQIFSSGNPLY